VSLHRHASPNGWIYSALRARVIGHHEFCGSRLNGIPHADYSRGAIHVAGAHPVARDHRGKAKLNFRLIGDSDPASWDLPPKPKWMRWSTYSRLEERFDTYEEVLDDRLIGVIARLPGLAAG
jgi:hypothetical protein